MSDLNIGEPDVIRKEDNILWLRAEIERLEGALRDHDAVIEGQCNLIERLENEIKAAIPHNQESRYELNRLQVDNERLRAALRGKETKIETLRAALSTQEVDDE